MADARKPHHDKTPYEYAIERLQRLHDADQAHAKSKAMAVALDRSFGARKSPLRYLPQFAIALVVLASLGLGACSSMRELKLALDNGIEDSKRHDTRSWYDHKDRWRP